MEGKPIVSYSAQLQKLEEIPKKIVEQITQTQQAYTKPPLDADYVVCFSRHVPQILILMTLGSPFIQNPDVKTHLEALSPQQRQVILSLTGIEFRQLLQKLTFHTALLNRFVASFKDEQMGDLLQLFKHSPFNVQESNVGHKNKSINLSLKKKIDCSKNLFSIIKHLRSKQDQTSAICYYYFDPKTRPAKPLRQSQNMSYQEELPPPKKNTSTKSTIVQQQPQKQSPKHRSEILQPKSPKSQIKNPQPKEQQIQQPQPNPDSQTNWKQHLLNMTLLPILVILLIYLILELLLDQQTKQQMSVIAEWKAIIRNNILHPIRIWYCSPGDAHFQA